MKDFIMSQTDAPSKTQGNCCCGSSADSSKNTASETREAAAADRLSDEARETAIERSNDCCGGHGSQ